MRKSFHQLFILLLLSISSYGQRKSIEETTWKGPVTDTIPVQLENGAIILTLKIDNRPYRFIFDTGASLSISGELFNRKQYSVLGSQAIRDATGNISTSKTVIIPQLKLGGSLIINCKADVLSYGKSSFFKCLDIDGMIGGDIFKNSLLEIDLKNNRLIISPHQEMHAPQSDEYPIVFDTQYSPFFDIRLKDQYTLNVLFDTGAEDLLTMPEYIFDESSHVCGYRILRKGRYSLAGAHNIPVRDDYRIALLDSMQLAGSYFSMAEINVVARTDISILGAEILKYGVMRLDYRNSRMSFTPYPGEKREFIAKDNFPGFSIGRENRMYIVNGIEFGSEADICGLKIGMQITKVANIDLTTYSRNKDCRILRKNLAMMKKFTIEYLNYDRRKKICTLVKPEVMPIGSESNNE